MSQRVSNFQLIRGVVSIVMLVCLPLAAPTKAMASL